MKKKMIYEAPAAEQMDIRFEQNIMSNYSSSKPSDATLFDSGNDQEW